MGGGTRDYAQIVPLKIVIVVLIYSSVIFWTVFTSVPTIYDLHCSWLGSVTVYTTHLIQAGLVVLVPVPIFLGLPFQRVRARLKFWSGTGEIWSVKSFIL